MFYLFYVFYSLLNDYLKLDYKDNDEDDNNNKTTTTKTMGLETSVLRIINEPTAAAIAYGLDKKVAQYATTISETDGQTRSFFYPLLVLIPHPNKPFVILQLRSTSGYFKFNRPLATQFTGFGLAGLCRRFLVWPASMVLPQNLVACTLLNMLHAKGEDDGIGMYGGTPGSGTTIDDASASFFIILSLFFY
jgi:hypothetical protein